MTIENWLILGILAAAVALFVSDRLRVDVVALLVLLTLILTKLVAPAEAFQGFASPAVVTVWAVFIISGALIHSGVADILARTMMRAASGNPRRLLLVLMLTAGGMSAFMNNIGAVAILLPAVVSMARQMEVPPSKLLMPLAFAALLGGNITLIGTPPNILATAILEDYGNVPTFGFFDFAPTGLLVLVAGVLYMMLVGHRLLPDRTAGKDLADEYPVRGYLSEVRVAENSPLVGRTLTQAGFGEKYDMNILHARRDGLTVLGPGTDRPLRAGDIILIEGSVQEIFAIREAEGLLMVEDWSPDSWNTNTAASADGLKLSEITLAPNSRMEGATLREIGFRAQYGLSVLAMRREGRSRAVALSDVPIRFGDALLVQGTAERLNRMRYDANFLVLEMPPIETRRVHKAPLTVAILLALLVTITAGWLDTATTMLLGALLMVLTGVLSMDEAYQAVDWKSVFLIAGMLPLGLAMETTGTALLLANRLVAAMGGLGVLGVLGGMFVLTALLTEVISNAAATVLMVPIAIDVAFGLGVSPQPFVMATVIAASTSFLTPIGHQVNVIIYGPGGYRFSDYARVGIWLNLILLAIVVLFLPLIWPF